MMRICLPHYFHKLKMQAGVNGHEDLFFACVRGDAGTVAKVLASGKASANAVRDPQAIRRVLSNRSQPSREVLDRLATQFGQLRPIWDMSLFWQNSEKAQGGECLSTRGPSLSGVLGTGSRALHAHDRLPAPAETLSARSERF